MSTVTEEKTTKGKINVQTENIFPIIKKFLYSDHEIFLRELVSNAVDAVQKLKTLKQLGKFTEEETNWLVEVIHDEKAKTITIKDNGIGMSEEEVDKYINQVAFSGAEEFLKKYKDKAKENSIIGHFGLGFYSSFMVSKEVEIITKSYMKTKTSVKWVCDGSPEYTLTKSDKKERGTEIILHLADDSLEFNNKHRIEEILNKYCKFLPVNIKFGTKEITEKIGEGDNSKDEKKIVDNIINNPTPAWTKKPVDLKDEDYNTFYRELYPYTFEDPLFNIHLNVDYPFNLTGILYFPRLKQNMEIQKNKIQLYSNQVFVTDSVEGIVPEFLTLLHGVLDSPDIPLNVSRSYLQSDSNVKKISSHITKKVADKLEDLFKKDRADFEKKWDDIRVFIQYGMLTDEKFYERAAKFYLFKNTEGKCFTFDEYKEYIKAAQTDKDKNLIYLYTSDKVAQHTFVSAAKDRGYDVLELDGQLDSHFINLVERKFENSHFTRVDGDTIDKLIKKDEAQVSKLTKEQEESLKPVFESQVPKEKFTVMFESLSEKDNPIIITQNEFMRRMMEMQKLQPGGFMGNMPEMYNLVVNSNHPLVSKILEEKDEQKKNQTAKQLADLALLSQNLLKGEELAAFIKRSLEIIK
ncbi:MAG: Chaperone protein HtpG [Bacteroidia bacterium]|nr:Chaperone protein HtpG [Bacteroidia bacterium]